MKNSEKKKMEDLRIMPEDFEEMMRQALRANPKDKKPQEQKKTPEKLTEGDTES